MPTKKAFLVGINKFRGGDIRGNDLQGCVNDIIQSRDCLVDNFGFKNIDIRLLADERATKEEIWARLVQYRAEIKADDLLVIQQSSHGTRYPLRDKKTGKLSNPVDVLCASNFTWDNPVLIGPEIGKLFLNLPAGAKVVFLLDACHTGDAFTRDLIQTIEGSPEKILNSRYVAPPFDIEHRFRGAGQNPIAGEIPEGVVLFSAADKDQTAADAYIEKKWRGAFTYHFWKAVKDIPGNETNKQILDRVRRTISIAGYSQIPGLECSPTESLKLFLNGNNVLLGKKEDEAETTTGFFTGEVLVPTTPPPLPTFPLAFP